MYFIITLKVVNKFPTNLAHSLATNAYLQMLSMCHQKKKQFLIVIFIHTQLNSIERSANIGIDPWYVKVYQKFDEWCQLLRKVFVCIQNDNFRILFCIMQRWLICASTFERNV